MGCGIWRHINEPQKECAWAQYGDYAISVFVTVCDRMNTMPVWLCWINLTDAKILLASNYFNVNINYDWVANLDIKRLSGK